MERLSIAVGATKTPTQPSLNCHGGSRRRRRLRRAARRTDARFLRRRNRDVSPPLAGGVAAASLACAPPTSSERMLAQTPNDASSCVAMSTRYYLISRDGIALTLTRAAALDGNTRSIPFHHCITTWHCIDDAGVCVLPAVRHALSPISTTGWHGVGPPSHMGPGALQSHGQRKCTHHVTSHCMGVAWCNRMATQVLDHVTSHCMVVLRGAIARTTQGLDHTPSTPSGRGSSTSVGAGDSSCATHTHSTVESPR